MEKNTLFKRRSQDFLTNFSWWICGVFGMGERAGKTCVANVSFSETKVFFENTGEQNLNVTLRYFQLTNAYTSQKLNYNGHRKAS